MDNSTVFQKTAKGNEEIKKHSIKLEYKVRSLLILIDGRKTYGQINETIRHLGLGPDAFQELEQLELIQAITMQASPAAVAAEPQVRTGIEKFIDAQRFMSEIANDALGFKGLFFKLKIERCSNVEELKELLEDFETMLGKKQTAEQANMARKTAENILNS
ncbi:MAG: hypothetical protein V4568_07090 [Pseudomonadota bacterium]